MMACRPIARVDKQEDGIVISVSCATHGNNWYETRPFKITEIEGFLEEGFTLQTVGAISPAEFYAVVNALHEAGIPQAARFLAN